MNNGKYETEQYKKLQQEKLDRNYGPIQEHRFTCLCGNEFTWVGRKKTKAFEKQKYCSRNCSNNRQEWWNKNATQYRTICFKHWEKKCLLCGFEKIVVVHHMDENKKNNNPENLIPLCPNHHEMFHSKFRGEVEPLIIEKLQNKGL